MSSKKIWNLEKLKEGFGRFYKEYGRLPTAPEIDKIEYLPSSRQIQRKFGGLEKLRALFGYRYTHFGKGEYRSKIASRTNLKGRATELALEKILKERFGEVFVHTEKIFDTSKNRVDFYIYSPDGNFGIDVFYTETMRDLQNNVNVKINKYQNFLQELFLVVGNEDFRQNDLNKYMATKKKALPEKTTIIAMQTLLKIINSKHTYPNPLH